jgi:hypothetical protein
VVYGVQVMNNTIMNINFTKYTIELKILIT